MPSNSTCARRKGGPSCGQAFFAQNLRDAYLRDIREDHRLFVPAGRGRVTFVDVRDVAEVATLAFGSPEQHDERAYKLTGHETIDFAKIAVELTAALGRPPSATTQHPSSGTCSISDGGR